VGETRVDLQHLLEDLRDAYAGSVEETILTEIVANALDSGASTIRVATAASQRALTVVDDGRGMQRRELARYHDIAATTKTRGQGIGFAGVGIKLALLVSQEVVTETRRGKVHVATRWHLASRHRAPWKWIAPPGLVPERGTAVRVLLSNPLSPLLDAGFVEETLRRHFEPLTDPAFSEILGRYYKRGVRFAVDGDQVHVGPGLVGERASIAIRLGRRRTPSATGYLARHAVALAEDRRGIAISTFGKIIKRGWDWLGVTPADPGRVQGVIEAPDLAACLTLNKNDFLRTGTRGATYLAYRKAVQEAVSRQLAAWGDASEEQDRRPRPVRLDRDLARVLEDLAGEFPLLDSLVDRKPGGQRRLPMPGPGDGPALQPLLSILHEGGGGDEGLEAPPKETRSPGSPPPTPTEPTPPSGEEQPPDAQPVPVVAATPPGRNGRRRPARYGMTLQFERRPGDDEPGRLVESTIWVNEAHPAFERAQLSRSLGYHIALTVALTLAPLAAPAAGEHLFVTRFLAEWGGAHHARRPARKRGLASRR
jgi:hypothetical protein